ncbi:MAG TPA: UvrD-helicase domain-containing protein [Acidobacteriaceae bacterium]|nr:UvrD-helicase domain-containing protein [Acidobacteriaceae bacterium]
MRSDPIDKPQRYRALEHGDSFIVQAPAGSGKTDLLTRRFLKLLAVVDEPEEILAITFTRAATAEMRLRILQDLEMAARGEASEDAERDALARAAIAHAEVRGWRLIEQPQRLNIETIDSLCLRIAQNQPLLSRFGGRLSPTEHAMPLYTLAARRTLELLGRAEPKLEAALQHLLALRDNNLTDCVNLITGMLAQRDQWIRSFPLTPKMSEDDWGNLRSALEHPLRDEVRRAHGRVYELMTRIPLLQDELVALAQYAIANGNRKIEALAGMRQFPKPELLAVEHWQCIAEFLLTKEGNLRKKVDKNDGFRPSTPEQKNTKRRMEEFLVRCSGIDGLQESLAVLRKTPFPRYDDRQWETLQHVFLVLGQSIAELKVLFAERNTVDFIESGLAARQVLSGQGLSPDTLLAISGNIRHLLVDEFQDTSRSQYELLTLLIQTWEAEEGRTGFLVGDPMQSVYLFRQAEVELFERVRRFGLVAENFTLALEPLELKTNFRSHAGLTTRWNEIFEAVFGDGGTGGIRYEQTVAAEEALAQEAVHVHPQILGDGDGRVIPEQRRRAQDIEAAKVLEIVRAHQPRIDEARIRDEEYRVAVLVRVKSHLAKIAALLREAGVPFRAVDLETLNERQELLDLMSLVRALLHPMDRAAWFSVLRAPWCGLAMRDLHTLAGADDKSQKGCPVPELIESRAHLLSEDGAARVQKVSGILRQALAVRFQGAYAGSFSQWIERTWRSLGGPRCLDATAHENAQTFFELLDAVTPDGMKCLTADFDAEMDRLFAQPDPEVSERAGVQLMTIHKAKGLGFDVVIVPGLERRGGQDSAPLISWLERTNPATGKVEMLAAPIGDRGDDTHATYAWVQRQRKQQMREELKRVLYVACTRARKSLHLMGTAEMTASGGLKLSSEDSLLRTAWPALKEDFEAALAAKQDKVIEFPASAAEEESLEMAAGEEPSAKLRLQRLPLDADSGPSGENVPFAASAGSGTEVAFERPEGSRDARHKGSVVHALLERVSRGAAVETLPAAARSLLRGLAYFGKALDEAVEEVLVAVRNCLSDPDGAWILASHRQAQSEISLTDWKGSALETLRPDRVFLAGATPQAEGEDYLWIIDYKMTAPAGAAGFFERQRATYAPQLARYERALREAEGIELPVRFGLYYPRVAQLDWWGTD